MNAKSILLSLLSDCLKYFVQFAQTESEYIKFEARIFNGAVH